MSDNDSSGYFDRSFLCTSCCAGRAQLHLGLRKNFLTRATTGLQRSCASRPAWTEGKDVVTLAAHRDGEFDRLEPCGPVRSAPADPRVRRPARWATRPGRNAGRAWPRGAGGRALGPARRRRRGPARDMRRPNCVLPKTYEYPFFPTMRASGLRTSSPARRRWISARKSYRGRQLSSLLARSLT